MTIQLPKLLVAGAIAGLLGLGGVTLASAQEAPSTTETPSTVAPDAPQAPADAPADSRPLPGRDGHCDHDKGGAGSGTTSTPDTSTPDTTTAPSVDETSL